MYRIEIRLREFTHPIGFCHIEVDVLVERDGVRVARGKTELRDHSGGYRHRRGQISVYMLNGPEEKELVADDPAATVGEVRIQIDVGSWPGSPGATSGGR